MRPICYALAQTSSQLLTVEGCWLLYGRLGDFCFHPNAMKIGLRNVDRIDSQSELHRLTVLLASFHVAIGVGWNAWTQPRFTTL